MTEAKSDSNNIIDAEVVQEPASTAKVNASKSSKLALPFTLLVVIGAVAAGSAASYWGWQQLQQQQQAQSAQAQRLQAQQQEIVSLARSSAEFQSEERALVTAAMEQLQSVQQRLDSQNKRLLSMSTTSKEDWQLLEARYLLRLANQRLMTERDSIGSVAQLQAADNILRDLDDVALFSIRKAIAGDIAALKLAPSVDRDGVYLRLIGLADNIKQLPAIKPLPQQILEPQLEQLQSANEGVEVIERGSNGEEPGYLLQLEYWFEGLLKSAQDYVRIRQHDSALQVLPPEMQLYLSQNIRLNLEQAQLALLAEKQVIYRHSLAEARQLLLDYYQLNDQVSVFIAELDAMAELNIRRSLPDISSSLAQLDAYIERLHKLQPEKSTAISSSDQEV